MTNDALPANSVAFIFPGQGSQIVGMGRDLVGRFTEAVEVFEQADQALGFPLSKICFEGPAETLNLTANTQPAILTCSVAILRLLQRLGRKAWIMAGHSLGEYSALVAAGALDFIDAVRIARKRGEWMQQAVPVGAGSMAAILGLGEAEVTEICASIHDFVVTPANFNSPGQIVIAGHERGVALASQNAVDRGAKRAIPLPVSAPFHCPLMKPAEEKLAILLMQTTFRDLSVPLVCNVDSRIVQTGEDARDCLIRQVCLPVRWQQSIELMVGRGVTEFIEIGPGKVLSGLVRRISKESKVANVEDVATLEAFAAQSEPRQ
ncbi:MAG TPA: ACP S-malonyltransferase [Acidobacteriota bacterium]|jgi:[acyl-carrier-protein] S-malonyltransferase|nr:ACP S-malonyltransferase [Acidobacteriota bacterium]